MLPVVVYLCLKLPPKRLSLVCLVLLLTMRQIRSQTDTSCIPGGAPCRVGEDCCSRHCHNHLCAAGKAGCTDGGGACRIGQYCCSKTCIANVCTPANFFSVNAGDNFVESDQERSCTQSGGPCRENRHCCSQLCLPAANICSRGDRCVFGGAPCIRNDDCCSAFCLNAVCVAAGFECGVKFDDFFLDS